MPRKRSRRRNRPVFESLEARDLPATWGIPWADPQHLTMSLAPDGTNVFGQSNTLFGTLNAQLGAGTWEATILKAVQTWASSANINVGLVSDGGEPIGVAGAAEGDPRFGDIRISAAPMAPGVVAVGTPYDPSTGTLSGDIILNSNADFNTMDSGSYDLYTVVLHEAGHAFGFADSSDPSSFMYNVYGGPVTGLAPGAVPALQALYGAPIPDASEIGPGNPSNSTPEQLPTNNPNQPGVASDAGTLSSSQDADVFKYQPQSGASYASGIDIQVQTGGISLLDPTVTVANASGQVIATATASGALAGGVSLHVDGISAQGTYYVAVSGSHDVFGVGAFQLSVAPTSAGGVVVGGQHVSTQNLHNAPGLLGTQMLTASGPITPGGGSNLYAFTSPNSTSAGLSVSLQGWGTGIGTPVVTVYDASMNVVATSTAGLVPGSAALLLARVAPNTKYYLGVSDPSATGYAIGSYSLEAGFSGFLMLPPMILDVAVSGISSSVVAQASSLAQPIALAPSPITGNRLISSLTGSVTQAVYKVTPPHAASGTTELMTVAVVTLDGLGITPVVNVYDNKGNPVAAQVLAAEGGAYVVQLACSSAVSNYLIQVKGGAVGPSTWTGSYYFDATFGTAAATSQGIASGAASGQSAGLALANDELFRFVLSAGAGLATGEQMTVVGAGGRVVSSLYCGAGQSASQTVLLAAGSYTIYITPALPLGLLAPPSFVLVGFGLSDPIKAYSSGSGSTSPPTMPK